MPHSGQINLLEMCLSDIFWDMPQIRSERPMSGKLINLPEMGLSDLIWAIPRISSEKKKHFSGKQTTQKMLTTCQNS